MTSTAERDGPARCSEWSTAFATESGGPTIHTAILAGALEIPAVVGVGRLITEITGGDLVIVDGLKGRRRDRLDPDSETLAKYEAMQLAEKAMSARGSMKPKDVRSRHPRRHPHRAARQHRDFPSEAIHCPGPRRDREVGLYRTEFLYVNKLHDPTEEEHFRKAYREVLAALGPGRPVVIRTLDLGADKFAAASGFIVEKNPFLGLRSIRYCLKNKPLFNRQLRAILRASAFGDIRIMFPMISTVLELRQCLSLLRRSAGGFGRSQNRLQTRHSSWYNDRSSLGGHRGRYAGEAGELLLHRHQ